MRADAILFDFGGTLDSDGGHWLDRTQALYRRFEVPVDMARQKEAFYAAEVRLEQAGRVRDFSLRETLRDHLRMQFEILCLPGDGRAIADAFSDESEAILRRNASLLARWAAGRKLGVVSNNFGNCREVLESAGLLSLLSVVVDSAVVGVKKPDPKIFRLALDPLGIPPERAIMVGDSLDRDVAPSKSIGMRGVWLLGDRNPPAEERRIADACIQSLPELDGVLS